MKRVVLVFVILLLLCGCCSPVVQQACCPICAFFCCKSVIITYDKDIMMLQNACIRYDKTLMHKPSSTSRAVYQHEVDDDPCIHDEEDNYLDDNFAPDGIDTPSDDIYNIHNTNLKMNPHVKSFIPRKSPGKPKSNKGIPPKPRYNGPVYLPKHIYNMLNEDINKELYK